MSFDVTAEEDGRWTRVGESRSMAGASCLGQRSGAFHILLRRLYSRRRKQRATESRMDVRFGYGRGGRDRECDWRKLEFFLASPRLLKPWGKVLLMVLKQ